MTDNTKVNLVASVDSKIGNRIASLLRTAGDKVLTTSRNGLGDFNTELSHSVTWPVINTQLDRLFYTIGIGDGRVSRMEAMQVNAFAAYDFLDKIARSVKPGGAVVVCTSAWGSIGRLATSNVGTDIRASAYRMSKAALNMGVTILSKKHPNLRWVIIHPGLVNEKSTDIGYGLKAGEISLSTSAEGLIKNADNAVGQLSSVDWLGRPLEF
jgi:hypothetical protein